MTIPDARSRNRLQEVLLDPSTIPPGVADGDHERAVAINDLVEDNSFGVQGRDEGPYSLTIAQSESRLTFKVRSKVGETIVEFTVSTTPLRPLLRDYFLLCETYYSAIRNASPRQIEAIDRERAALHNEGASLIAARIADGIEIDEGTARRLFTVVSALHWKA
ncbi:MAG: UPF0262 family protein [Roseiarcus sp.]|jgi:uncharacterized protein (UPF0262 family)